VSNPLAIATVTATLRRELTHAMTAAVPGAVPGTRVTTIRPDRIEGSQAGPIVNLHLFAATPNSALRNVDLPARNGAGQNTSRNRVALDLHYLVSFHGDDATLVPQRLMAITARALNARPVLTPQMIRDAVADTGTFPFLPGSDLDGADESVRIAPTALSLEESAKVWGMYPLTPAAVSLAFVASVVLLDGETPITQGPPVRTRNVYVVPLTQPVVTGIVSSDGPEAPIVSGSTLIVSGRALRADLTAVRIDPATIDAAANAAGTEIRVALPASLLAGLRGAQVVHRMQLGTPPTSHRGAESNVAPFLLRPSVARDAGSNFILSVANVTAGVGTLRSADVGFTVTPAVGKRQRLALSLVEQHPPADRAPHAYSMAAPSRDQPAQPETSATFTLRASNVESGAYLVRLQVDGADSVFVVDTNPASMTFNEFIGPAVVIP